MSNKNILFFNKKGGQGKTTLATNYSKYVNGFFLTNDENNFTEETFDIKSSLIPMNKDISDIYIDEDRANIFDFGGFTDERVLTVASFCDYCVVPIYFQSKIDLKAALETMETLKKQNENSIFVINNTNPKETKELKSFLEEKATTFFIPKSTYFNNNNKSIYEQLEIATGLKKHIIEKNIIPHLNKLFNFLRGY